MPPRRHASTELRVKRNVPNERYRVDPTHSPELPLVVEVPGALSQGRTREEARENVLDALRVVLAPDQDDKSVLAGRSEALDLTLIR